MRIWLLISQSLKAIFANKGRSLLTILGIVIGIGSIIGLVSLGAGVRVSIADRILALGATNLTILPGAVAGAQALDPTKTQSHTRGFTLSTSTLTEEDMLSLADRKEHPHIKYVSGEITSSAVAETKKGNKRFPVLGISPDYFAINSLTVGEGRLFTQRHVDEGSQVLVMGKDLAKELYGDENPIDKILEIEGTGYQVIGIFNPADESGLADPNNQAYIPYTAAAETFESHNFNFIYVQAVDENVVPALKREIRKTLMKNHDITNSSLADFTVISSGDVLSAVDSITNMLTSLLAGIAAISLLVGGIGIMNIMLVAVSERTREIGLRKAVGARTVDILNQFLIEAVLLTLTGGILGIGFGILIGRISESYLGFTPIVSSSTILLAVGVSSVVGLIFGVYPAMKASRLDPINALRYE
ncbi:MAG: ABC transporter permease [Syntrophomonadales bacterium]|jgi:putative ABC transport system permease protein